MDYKKIAVVTASVGALNYGLVSIVKFDLVGKIAGLHSVAAMIVPIAIGVAGGYILYDVFMG